MCLYLSLWLRWFSVPSTADCQIVLVNRPDWTTATLLYGALQAAFRFLQRVQNSAARIVLQAPRRSHAQPLLRELHWLPIQHRIEYKVAVLTSKSRSSATAPTYLSRHIKARVSERTIISANSLSVFKSRLKTYFFRKAFE